MSYNSSIYTRLFDIIIDIIIQIVIIHIDLYASMHYIELIDTLGLGAETMCKPQWYASFCIYAITIQARRAGYIISGTNEWRTKTYKSFLSLKNKKSKNAQESTDLSMPIEPHTNTRP